MRYVVIAAAALAIAGCTNPEQPASGTARLAADPGTVDLGIVATELGPQLYEVRITNTGNAPSASITTVVSGPGAVDFSIDAARTTCAGQRLPPAGSCIVGVVFDPATVGPRTASLEVTGGAGDGQRLVIPLSATTQDVLRIVFNGYSGAGGGMVRVEAAGRAPVSCVATCGVAVATPTVTLTATAGPGSYFESFSGASCGASPCVVTLGTGTIVSATFRALPQTVLMPYVARATNEHALRWTFSGTVHDGSAAAGFECTLDSANWTPCTSPFQVAPAASGVHAFAVRARDAAGHVDGTPIADTVEVTDVPLLRYTMDGDVQNAGSGGPLAGIVGGATFPVGKFGEAVKFDGSASAGITLPGTAAIVGSRPAWTVSLWFRQDELTTWAWLFEMRALEGWETYYGAYPDRMPTCGLGECAGFPTPALGAWHNLVYRYQGESLEVGGPLEIWLDGVHVGTLANPTRAPLRSSTIDDVMLGHAGAYGYHSKFYVDEVRFYDTVFTPAEQCVRVSGGTWTGASCALP